jgi:hypothetical protein
VGCRHERSVVAGRYPSPVVLQYALAACSPWRGGKGRCSTCNVVATASHYLVQVGQEVEVFVVKL